MEAQGQRLARHVMKYEFLFVELIKLFVVELFVFY